MTAPLDVPRWPAGLQDTTPLPYAYWRVLNAVDGQRSYERLGAAVNVPEAQVRQVLGEVQRWLERAATREQPMNDSVLAVVREAVISVLGPMGDLIVDDVLDELPASAPLSAMLTQLQGQLSEAQMQGLIRRLRTRGIA